MFVTIVGLGTTALMHKQYKLNVVKYHLRIHGTQQLNIKKYQTVMSECQEILLSEESSDITEGKIPFGLHLLSKFCS